MPLKCFGTGADNALFNKVIYNNDGTVSGINTNTMSTPIPLTAECCKQINLTFDPDRGQCLWKAPCELTDPFTISIAPKNADGAIFEVGPNETCTCEVEFDYLFSWDADKLVALAATNATTLQQDISNTQNAITSLETAKSNTETEIAILQGSITTVTNQITSLNQQIGALEAKSALTTSEQAQLASLKAQLLVAQNSKTDLENQVSAKQSQIAVFDNQIASNNRVLNNLNTQLSGTSTYNKMMSNFNSAVKLDVLSSVTTTNTQVLLQLQNTNVNVASLEDDLFIVDDLLTFLDDNTDGLTGIYLTGSSNNQTQIINNLKVEGFANGITVDVSDFKSPWLHHKMVVNDVNALELIKNQKVKLGINIKSCNSPFSVLIDNIKINKVCVKTDSNEVFITECPSFNLKRIPDNKKSWITSGDTHNRTYDLSRRKTDYKLNNSKLVVNTKEIDLDIDAAKAIECGMYKYYQKSVGCNIIEGDPCSCPAGYTPDLSTKTCTLTTITGITSTGPTVISQNGSTTGVYGHLGAYFYPQIDLADPRLPIRRYYTGGTGDLLYTTGDVLSEDYIDFNKPLWGSFNVALADGRLNSIGVQAPTDWIGFTKCIEITTTKTYYVAMAADNFSRFRVNGNLIVEFPETGGVYGSNGSALQYNFKKWHLFPITLNAGTHVIEMEGKNQSGASAFGAEIYDADFDTLTGSTTTATLNTIFSTGNLIGQAFQIGASAGYSCPTGFALYTCSGGTPVCYSKLISNMSGCTDTKTLQDFITQPITGITTSDNFIDVTRNSLIDVKNRQTISQYGTLNIVYDRYIQPLSSCAIKSNSYTYPDISRISKLVGNNWVDLVEQVVPSTTIWGATNVIRNTEFDRNKYSYNRYTLQLSGSSFSGLGQSDSGTTVTVSDVGDITGGTQVTTGVVVGNFNEGSEFIGRVTIANGPTSIPTSNNTNNVPYILIP